MKLSNKILIGFFGFAFIYLTAAFMEVRLRGNPAVIDDSNSLVETVDITGVNYLVLPALEQTIDVIGSDQPKLEVRSMSGDLLQKLKYNVSGDTLTLEQLDLEKDQRIRISVYVPKNSFTGMSVNGARVNIKELDQKVLSVSQNDGSIRMHNKNRIGKLVIQASNGASFTVSDTELAELSVQLDNAEVSTDSPVRLLEGSIKNDSYIQIKDSEEIQLKKDKSSGLYLR